MTARRHTAREGVIARKVMTTKTSKAPGAKADPRMVIPSDGTKPISILRMMDSHVKGQKRATLFRAVAERIRTCMLDPDEAALIAKWFDRLAAGEDSTKILWGETRGRPKRSTGGKFIGGEVVRLPDHVDLCWTIRQAIARGNADDVVFGEVAELYGVTSGHIAKLYARILPTLGIDSSIPK